MSKSYKHMNAETAERARNVKNARRNRQNLRSQFSGMDPDSTMERHVELAMARAPRNKSSY